MRALLLALMLGAAACRTGAPPTAPAAPVWAESRTVGSGEPVIVHVPAGTPPPEVEGLSIVRGKGDGAGDTWEITGKDGSYILPVPAPPGASGAASPPITLYLDIGVKGPVGGPMEDLATLPPPPEPTPWWVWVVAAAGSALGVLAVNLLRRLRPAPPPPPPEPAHVVARREWARLRERRDLPPEQLAVELSAVYRRYVQAVNGWPATARTTREILDNLSGTLLASDLDAARRLLSAMDLVKFADRATHEGLFEQLDADFAALCVPVAGATAVAPAGSAR